jgi:hypothetical protein
LRDVAFCWLHFGNILKMRGLRNIKNILGFFLEIYVKIHYLFTWFNTVLGRNTIRIYFHQYIKQNKINPKFILYHFVINSAAQL